MDWKTAPADHATGTITITPQSGAPMQVQLESVRLPGVTRKDAQGFVESDGYVAIEAADTSSRTTDGATHWEELPGFGETRSAMTVFPVTAASNLNSTAGLKYHIYLSDEGDFTLHAVLAPTLNFVPGRGLRFAVSIDNGPRIVVDALEHNSDKDWEEAVSDGVKKVSVPLSIADSGYHTLDDLDGRPRGSARENRVKPWPASSQLPWSARELSRPNISTHHLGARSGWCETALNPPDHGSSASRSIQGHFFPFNEIFTTDKIRKPNFMPKAVSHYPS